MATSNDQMETDNPASPSDTNSSVFDDYSSATDDDVDAQVLESHADRKRKHREGKQKLSKENNKISKIAKARQLPHQATTLVTSVTQFIKYMMGMESSGPPLPEPPSENEILQWTNHVEARRAMVQKKVNCNQPENQNHDKATSSKKKKQELSANEKFLRKERLEAIRKEGVPLIQYTPAREIPSKALQQPISSQTKQIVDNEFKNKGFSRITFDWTARSLSSSRWNTATALILIENWSRWYKTQSQNLKDLEHDIQGVVERWLGTMRGTYSKQLRSLENSHSTPSSGGQGSTSAVSRMPVSAKTKKNRQKFPTTKTMTRTSLAHTFELFLTGAAKHSPRVLHQLDEAAKQLQTNPRARKTLADLLRRGDIKIEPADAEELMEAPIKLPIDCYNPAFLDALTIIQRRLLKVGPPIGLQEFLTSICQQTIPGYMNTDETPGDNGTLRPITTIANNTPMTGRNMNTILSVHINNPTTSISSQTTNPAPPPHTNNITITGDLNMNQ
ncbi:uncharacterized protein PGTG_19669 [Puccinia graminis f. sp. tritici CRL 75-36-700-3]|uniref:Uncharacterized protein n=1 Tax=Puccinia graminis f. sp. tritici (strain CRL 75-36-700-3 / race SCCL) TaxID=418459 RepID=E3LAX5_PUCGT|nr:uncharacterized protein PGTG_19669 [Puccinia graminis f. sp. tritici CRL 75-36-700-3]EFP93700.1 hypothetical protein PGTG_19669 [Puccinia graminis f. sp. tritici CRL 75-36-700-3]